MTGQMIQFFDNENNLLHEMDYDENDRCSKYSSGEHGSLCGGCTDCLIRQCEFYDGRIEIICLN